MEWNRQHPADIDSGIRQLGTRTRGRPVLTGAAASAILERLLHHSQEITIQGNSYRMRKKRRVGVVDAREANTKETRNHEITNHRTDSMSYLTPDFLKTSVSSLVNDPTFVKDSG